VGLTLAGNFVAKKRDEQTVERFLDHLDHAVKLIGVESVAFGFDFMDYFEEFSTSNLTDVTDATKVNLIVAGMRRRGYTEEEIEKICYKNFYDRYQDKMIRSN
jgi:membrane dipeptidase